MLKNVPDKRNCGSVIIFARGGIVLSLLAIPEIIKPKPINKIKPMDESSSMVKKVENPLMSVNPKAKYPIEIINMAPSIANAMRLMASPNTM